MERNRRIAKAYARKRTITVNGSEGDYLDGRTLGLNSFENPDRDSKTSNIKQYIGEVSATSLGSNLGELIGEISPERFMETRDCVRQSQVIIYSDV